MRIPNKTIVLWFFMTLLLIAQIIEIVRDHN